MTFVELKTDSLAKKLVNVLSLLQLTAKREGSTIIYKPNDVLDGFFELRTVKNGKVLDLQHQQQQTHIDLKPVDLMFADQLKTVIPHNDNLYTTWHSIPSSHLITIQFVGQLVEDYHKRYLLVKG